MTGEELKTWRKKNGWSQSKLKNELEVGSRQTIVNWESADQVPRLVELAVIAIDQVEACRRNSVTTQFDQEAIAKMLMSKTSIQMKSLETE